MASTGCLFDPRQKQSPGSGESIGTERNLTLFLIRSLDFGGWGFTEPKACLGSPCLFVICDQMGKVSSRKGVWQSQKEIVTREKLLKMNPLKKSRFYPQELGKCLKFNFEKKK